MPQVKMSQRVVRNADGTITIEYRDPDSIPPNAEAEHAVKDANVTAKGIVNQLRKSAPSTPDVFTLLELSLTAVFQVSARVKALEAAQSKNLADAYKGIFRVDEAYSRGDLATHKGGCWLALKDSHSEPGTDSSWKLIAKP